jgi:cation transport ATPase
MASSGNNPQEQEPESADAKEDRQLIELLNELRVALPGVQMLFGFMLAVPFTQPFGSLTDRQQFLFFAAFLSTAGASICFITPTSFHRITWQRGVKGHMLRVSSGLTIAGTVFLGVAISCVVGFLSSYLYNSVVAVILTAVVLGVIAVLWYSIPLVLRERHGS